VVDIDPNVDDRLLELVQVELLGQHLQPHQGPTVRIRHAQRNPRLGDAETRRLDVVVQKLEKDFHNMGIRCLAPENALLLVHFFFFFLVWLSLNNFGMRKKIILWFAGPGPWPGVS
jgi:hypothetical protein